MVIGDPNKFSFIIDIVEDWSSNGFVAGFFYITISGEIFPRELVNTTLNSDLYLFFNNKESSLLTHPVDIDLFKKNKVDAYKAMYYLTYPQDTDCVNNYIYSCQLKEIEDFDYYIFSVSDGESIRILGAKIDDNILNDELTDLEEIIHEVYLSKKEINSLTYRLKGYYEKYILK